MLSQVPTPQAAASRTRPVLGQTHLHGRSRPVTDQGSEVTMAGLASPNSGPWALGKASPPSLLLWL